MKEAHYIVDNPLPLNQDFAALKEKGLSYIQQAMNANWTNLNASDSGVTILDQVCFALTELGYCNDFSMADIITGYDGKPEIKDQFYLPEEILTTSPLTIADYVKYVIDSVEGIDNLVISPVYFSTGQMIIPPTSQLTIPAYQVYLKINAAVKTNLYADICRSVFFCLNKARNLGEVFLMPRVLQPVPVNLYATITIQNEAELSSVLLELDAKLQNYIFPKVVQKGYAQLHAEGLATNRIFNGPRLKNGWVPSHEIGSLRMSVQASDLVPVIGSVKGVAAVSGLSLNLNTPPCTTGQMLYIDCLTSFKAGYLNIQCKGKILSLKNSGFTAASGLTQSLSPATTIAFGAWNESQTPLPKGKYRDIDSYYSIQNTLPEIFGVGANSVDSNATPFQVAQSRQLKGYLTLLDQVLANQFSQLANVPRLLSFKNPVSGIPSQKKIFYAYKDSYEKKHDEYPVPFLAFSPTYFYRSLYAIPHIKDLLKDNETFNFYTDLKPAKKEEKDTWFRYRQDPYNSYMIGLKALMVDERVDIERRNAILDHLLARHGESPLLLDTLIDGTIYTGNRKKDQVIIKSLYLQNIGLLSYYRQKAYNFIGANAVPVKPTPLPGAYLRGILKGNADDFIFMSGKINNIEKLGALDFVNYSAMELKLSLLFGLRTLYRDYIVKCFHKIGHYKEKIKQAEPGDPSIHHLKKKIKRHRRYARLAGWFIHYRRGLILLENGLLQDITPTFSETVLPNTNATAVNVSSICLLFPAFVFKHNKETMMYRLSLFLQNALPPGVQFSLYEVKTPALRRLVRAFGHWHNSLVFPSTETEQTPPDQQWPNNVSWQGQELLDFIKGLTPVTINA